MVEENQRRASIIFSCMKMKDLPVMMCRTEQCNDVVFLEFPDNSKVDLASAHKIVANRLDFTKHEKHYLIIDVSNVRHVSIEAREFMQRADGGLQNILAAAFIATNPVSSLIANIFIKTPKDFEARFFSNKDDAFKWICTHRTKNQIIPNV